MAAEKFDVFGNKIWYLKVTISCQGQLEKWTFIISFWIYFFKW